MSYLRRVRFGSFADIEVCAIKVCFALKSRHSPTRFPGPLSANSGHAATHGKLFQTWPAARDPQATCTIIGLPAPNVKSLAKPSLTLVRCLPSLALVGCLRMVLLRLTASWYPAGLRCPCRSTPSLISLDPSPAPTYPYARLQAILYLWRPRG